MKTSYAKVIGKIFKITKGIPCGTRRWTRNAEFNTCRIYNSEGYDEDISKL